MVDIANTVCYNSYIKLVNWKDNMFIKCFASGTNIQRIAKNADKNQIDCVLDVAYSQLEQTEPGLVKRKFWKLEDTSLYELLENNYKEEHVPSWTKIWAKPNQCKDFLSTLFNRLVGNDDMSSLNLDACTEEQISGMMVFTSANNKQMDQAAKLIRKALNDEWEVIALNGSNDDETEERYNNRTAQEEIANKIKYAKEDGKKGFIILSNMMGSRSFSVPEIQASLIMYDKGSVDATSQKVSRSLTPGKTWDGVKKEYGHIVSLSFNPNRCEVVEEIVMYEAIQVQRAENKEFNDAVEFVNRSISIFKVSEDGDIVEVSDSDLFTLYGETENLLRVADVTVDVAGLLDSNAYEILGNIKIGKKTNADTLAKLAPKAKKGKDKEKEERKGASDAEKAQRQIQKLVNEAIRSLNRSATTVYNLTMSGSNYKGCLELIASNPTASLEFAELYGVTANNVLELVNAEILNTPLLDVIVQNSKNDTESWF